MGAGAAEHGLHSGGARPLVARTDGAMAEFDYPPFYAYPPYFTLQPVLATREKQLASWKELVLKFCQHHGVCELSADDHADGTVDVLADADKPLFYNRGINRGLQREAKVAVIDALAADGHAEWLGAEKRRARVLFKRLDEYAGDVKRWVDDNALSGTVYTLYEIAESPDVPSDLRRLDRSVLARVFEHASSRGVCAVFSLDGGAGDVGVKLL